jgi:hypothetical protein
MKPNRGIHDTIPAIQLPTNIPTKSPTDITGCSFKNFTVIENITLNTGSIPYFTKVFKVVLIKASCIIFL